MIDKFLIWLMKGLTREFVSLFHWFYFAPRWGIHLEGEKEPLKEEDIVVFEYDLKDFDIWHFNDEYEAYLACLEKQQNTNKKYRIYNYKGRLLYKL